MLDRVGFGALHPLGCPSRHSRSAARALMLACLLTILAASAAHAELAPVTSPGGSVDGFAASQGAWLVGLSVSGLKAKRARISRDRGQTWSEVTLPTGTNAVGGEFSGVVVGPDRAFYVAVRYPYALAAGAFGRLLRIDPVNDARDDRQRCFRCPTPMRRSAPLPSTRRDDPGSRGLQAAPRR